MSEDMGSALDSLQGISEGDAEDMGFLREILTSSFTESGLDPQTFMLVRLAALAALDAAPASWLMNLAVGREAVGLGPDLTLGTLIAIAPVIGTARVVSAAGNMLKALKMAEIAIDRAES